MSEAISLPICLWTSRLTCGVDAAFVDISDNCHALIPLCTVRHTHVWRTVHARMTFGVCACTVRCAVKRELQVGSYEFGIMPMRWESCQMTGSGDWMTGVEMGEYPPETFHAISISAFASYTHSFHYAPLGAFVFFLYDAIWWSFCSGYSPIFPYIEGLCLSVLHFSARM